MSDISVKSQVGPAETQEEKYVGCEYKKWKKEKELIPVMISKYCNGNHGTHKGEICQECQELTDYALFRLEKCPFKKDKHFCSFCKIHCYKPEYQEKIRAVMRYSGPRMMTCNPIFAMSHVTQMLKYKRSLKKQEKKNE